MTEKEKYCSNCRHDTKLATEYPCNECCNAYTSKYESKTNYDKVKEMSLDELANFICYNDFGGVESIKKWLESEVQ